MAVFIRTRLQAQLIALLVTLAVLAPAQPAAAYNNELIPNPSLQAGASGDIVVLLHGFGRNAMSMWLLGNRLEDAGFEVHRIGYRSLRTTTDKMLNTVSSKIQHCCADSGRTVHFVGHSLGGLLVRAYLDLFRDHQLGRVVLIGAPSGGTPFVDKFQDKWWMKLAGEAAQDLGTDEDSFPSRLKSAPYYAMGIIAGDTDSKDMFNQTPDADDGLIPVSSTVVYGMSDFIVLQANHSLMRYNRDVAEQTKAFLRTGRFDHSYLENQQENATVTE